MEGKVYDPILSENKDRFVLFPIKYQEFWNLYKKSVACFWTVEELDFTEDLKDWDKLTDNEKHFIKHVLAFFSSSDGIVNENLNMNFANEVQVPEIRCLYSCQSFIESIHQEAYALLIDTYIKDEVEKHRIFNAIETIPIIKKKAEWAMKWFSRDSPFGERIVAFSAVEGIFFSGSFCAIFWLKKRGLMPGLCTSNEFISRDENMHTVTAVKIHKYLHPSNKCSPERITEIIKGAVEIEEEFCTDALPVSLIGMNAGQMCQYIHFVADLLLESHGAPKVWNEPCPFEWMQLLSIDGKTNFFEKRVSEYSKAGLGVSRDEQVFTLDADF
jgi:ribonucleotide reductase beta subunit family protein with ferritin-like domain